jgi:hypothetical protein
MYRSFIVAIVFVLSNAASATDSLCRENETVYFSCAAGKKLISLCGSKQLNESEGYLTYRFGTERHLELEFPTNISHPKGLFSVQYLLLAHDERIDISFKIGDYLYNIYDEFIGGQGDPNDTKPRGGAGIAVSKESKAIADIQCTSPATNKIAQLKFLFKKNE